MEIELSKKLILEILSKTDFLTVYKFLIVLSLNKFGMPSFLERFQSVKMNYTAVSISYLRFYLTFDSSISILKERDRSLIVNSKEHFSSFPLAALSINRYVAIPSKLNAFSDGERMLLEKVCFKFDRNNKNFLRY